MTPPKLHAIFLESRDEITSVIDQIRSCPDATVALVAGQRIGLLQSMVNLKLIQKNSQTHRKSVLLVTVDPVARSLAEQIEMPVFHKLDQAEQSLRGEPITPPQPKPAALPQTTTIKKEPLTLEIASPSSGPPDATSAKRAIPSESTPDSPRTFFGKLRLRLLSRPQARPPSVQRISFHDRPLLLIVLVFALLPILAGVYAALVILPHATVVIVPRTQEFVQEIEIKAAERNTEINHLSREIPAFYYETSDEAMQTAPATKKMDIGTKATGKITIYNQGFSDTITLAPGTRITSYDGKIFTILNETRIPGEVFENRRIIQQGVKPSVQVEAFEVGEEYNIDKTNFTVFNIDTGADFDANSVWGESYETFSGGEHHEATVVGQEDIDTLRTKLLIDLAARTNRVLDEQKAPDQIFLLDAIQNRIIEEELSAPVDQEVSDFTLRIRIQSRGLAIKEPDVSQIIDRAMSLSVPADFEPLTGQAWQTGYEVKQIDFDTHAVTFLGSGRGLIAYRLSLPDLTQRLLGKTREESAAILATFDDRIEQYDIRLSPFWVHKIPNQAGNLTIDKVSSAEFQTRINP